MNIASSISCASPPAGTDQTGVPSPYAQSGQKFLELGYCAIPARPGTKVPGMIVGGRWLPMSAWSTRYRDRLPSEREIESWERAPGGPGICILTGRASGGLVAVDCDTEDAAEALRRALPYTPVRKRGQKGETLFFRAGPHIASRAFNRPRPDIGPTAKERLVDVLAEGKQTIAPPSIHPSTGKPYIWTGETALDATPIDELPKLPDDALDLIAKALEPIGYQADAERKAIAGIAADADDPWRALNEHALANLDAWVPRLPLTRLRKTATGWEAVPDWRPSNTGRPINVRKLNLKIHPQGIRDFGDEPGRYTAVDLVIKCGLASDASGAFVWLSDATGWGSPVLHAPKPREIVVDGVKADAETGEIVETTATPADDPCSAPPTPRSPAAETGEITGAATPAAPDVQCGPDFADRILQLSGLVPDIAQWILSASRRPQRRLAVAAALCVVGTVASRQIVTPTRANTNLYLLLLAKSGNGKDAPLRALKAVLSAARLECMIGPEGVGSDVALFDHVKNSPASAMPIDEFGDYVAAISGQRAAPHVLKIMAAMRTLWDGGLKKTSHSIARPSVTLDNPCLSLLCASTPAQFFDAVGQKQALDGFLNRFLLIHAPDKAARNDGNLDIEDVPAAISNAIAALADRPGELNPFRFRLPMAEDQKTDKAERVDWTTEAEARWRAYEDEVLARMDVNPTQEAFAARCALNALKVATILALSENWRSPMVTPELVDIGIDLAETSLFDMINAFESHLPESQTASLQDKILARIRQEGNSMTHRALFRSVRRAFDRPAAFDDLIKILVESGQLEEAQEKPKNGGPATRTYHLLE